MFVYKMYKATFLWFYTAVKLLFLYKDGLKYDYFQEEVREHIWRRNAIDPYLNGEIDSQVDILRNVEKENDRWTSVSLVYFLHLDLLF